MVKGIKGTHKRIGLLHEMMLEVHKGLIGIQVDLEEQFEVSEKDELLDALAEAKEMIEKNEDLMAIYENIFDIE